MVQIAAFMKKRKQAMILAFFNVLRYAAFNGNLEKKLSSLWVFYARTKELARLITTGFCKSQFRFEQFVNLTHFLNMSISETWLVTSWKKLSLHSLIQSKGPVTPSESVKRKKNIIENVSLFPVDVCIPDCDDSFNSKTRLQMKLTSGSFWTDQWEFESRT